jgi:phthalate 4,5-dioxygenase reductase subunit
MESLVLVNPDTADAADHPAGASGLLNLTVTRKDAVADGIYQFELRDPRDRELPPFTPGSHITVELPNGSRRSYSLCNNPADRHRYLIAVKRDAAGRGGSVSMADEVDAGQHIAVSEPRNNFELSSRAKDFVFIAGGIGITPILSMMRHLRHTGGPRFKLYYLTRDAASTAFLDEIKQEFPGQVTIHHDNGDRNQALDLWPLFAKPAHTHVYCCGPKGLMDAVQAMSGHWAAGTVHFESFGVDATVHAESTPFVVHLVRSGDTFEVGADETLLEALRRQGHQVPSSCESGTCGSCRTRYVGGEPEHRDMVLDEEEQAEEIMVCVSRAKSARLDLDL